MLVAIASNAPCERLALAALCESQGWSSIECDSVRAFVRLIHRTPPAVVLVRHRLDDGYSDDVISALASLHLLPATKVIVLLGAGTLSSTEVRQLTLGADCVQRDPVRPDVLTTYIAKYISVAGQTSTNAIPLAEKNAIFCGGVLCAIDRVFTYNNQAVTLTPRETALAEQLAHSRGAVITYDSLYRDVLHRRFQGDTSNMRVLLGKLGASLRSVGITLGLWVEVISKTGYRYRDPGS